MTYDKAVPRRAAKLAVMSTRLPDAISREVREIEVLLASCAEADRLERARRLALQVAQAAPNGLVASLALQVGATIACFEKYPRAEPYGTALLIALHRLASAVGA